MESRDNRFGQWLKGKRQELGITQEEFARRVPCAYETIRKLEAGTRRPSRQVTELIGRALNISDDEIPDFPIR